MRKYFSNFAKRRRKSLLRRYVVVTSYPSLLQAKNECKKDSQEKQDFNRDRHLNGFIEPYEDTQRVDLQEEALKQRHKKVMETSKSDSEQKHFWTGQEEKWTEETSTDEEQGNDGVEWKQGARPRLKKKDSTRRPRYKDEIMLSDNIDIMVEKEIPEISVKANVQTEDIEYILNEDIPPDSQCSIGKTRSEGEDSGGKDNLTTRDGGGLGARWSRPKEQPTRRTRNSEDKKRARKIKYVVNDKEPLGRSKDTSSAGSWREKSDQNVSIKTTVKETEERVLANTPFAIISVATPGLTRSNLCRDEMDEEVITVAKEIQEMIEDKPFDAGSNGKSTSVFDRSVPHPRIGTNTLEAVTEDDKIAPAVSRCSAQLQVQSDSTSCMNTKKQSTKYSVRENYLAEDIDYVLNDDISNGYSSKQEPFGETAATEKAQSFKMCSTSKNSDIGFSLKNAPNVHKGEEHGNDRSSKGLPKRKEGDDNLAKDIEYILTDYIGQTGTNGQTSSLLGPLPSPKKIILATKSKEENDQLNKDIEYVLSDDIFAPEPDKAISSSLEGTMRPKTSNPKLALEMDMEKVLDVESLASTTTSCQHPINNRLDLRKLNQDVNEMAEVIEYILSGDNIDEGSTPLRSGGKRYSVKEPLGRSNQATGKQFIGNSQIASREGVPSTSNAGQCYEKETCSKKRKCMATSQEVSRETNSSACKVANGPVLQLQSDLLSSSDAELQPNTNSTRDVHTTGTISSSSGAIQRPKTRNPKRTFAIDVNSLTQGSSQAVARSRVFSRHKQDLVNKPRQANGKLKKDDTLKGPNISSSCPALRAKNKHTTKKSHMMVLEDINLSVDIATSSCAVSHSPQDSFQEQKLPANGATLAKKQKNVKSQEDASSVPSLKSISPAETPSKKKTSPHQYGQTEETVLEEAILAILDIPAVDLGPSAKYLPNISQKREVRTNSPRKPNQIEEDDLDEAIKAIFGIPAADLDASVKYRSDNDKHETKENLSRKPTPTEEIDLYEAISEVFGTQVVDLEVSLGICSESNSRQEAKWTSMRKETKRRPSPKALAAESRGIDFKKPNAQAPAVTSASGLGYQGSRASFSSSKTKNCESGCSLASGDTLRPMAAGFSMGTCSSIKPQSSEQTKQELFVSKGERSTAPALLDKEEAVVPTLDSLESMATNKKTAEPVTCRSSHRTISGMLYNLEELKLMNQIEREAL